MHNQDSYLAKRWLTVLRWSQILSVSCLFALGAASCEYGYQLLPNTPRSLLGGTAAVSVRQAWLLAASMHVNATITNDGRRPLQIDYREWALRGPDGRTFPLRQDRSCCTEPASLVPGQSQDIALEFPLSGSNALEWPTVELVVGGVRELPDGVVQVLGTVPFTRSGLRERFDDQRNRR